MARELIGTTPKQVAWRNPKRRMLSVQFIPSSIVAGNTGLVFGKWGAAPKADSASNTWDFVLNAGAADGTNLDESLPKAPEERDLWLISDTAGQAVNVIERNLDDDTA